MKKQIIIAVSLLTLTFISCTKKSSSSSTGSSGDSTFNGSYLLLTANGKTFNEKDVTIPNAGHIVTVTEATTLTGIEIVVKDDFGTYGLFQSNIISASGSGVGTYTICSSCGTTQITQANPVVGYGDTSGTVNVTYNGSDYIQGTISTTLYANGFNYPATGSFKIYH